MNGNLDIPLMEKALMTKVNSIFATQFHRKKSADKGFSLYKK